THKVAIHLSTKRSVTKRLLTHKSCIHPYTTLFRSERLVIVPFSTIASVTVSVSTVRSVTERLLIHKSSIQLKTTRSVTDNVPVTVASVTTTSVTVISPVTIISCTDKSITNKASMQM